MASVMAMDAWLRAASGEAGNNTTTRQKRGTF